MTPEEKSQLRRADFSRLFPRDAEELKKRLKLLGKKSAKGRYEWDQGLVHDAWIQIARCFVETASKFDVEFDVTVDGVQVEYIPPKRKTK